MNFTLRESKPAEIAQLAAIEYSAGQLFAALPTSWTEQYGWIFNQPGRPAEGHLPFIEHNNSWVAVDENDHPLGFIIVESILEDGLHIEELSVDQDYQGNGIGRKLIEHVLAVARSRHCAFVSLTTFRDVAWNRPFYQRLGFQLCTPLLSTSSSSSAQTLTDSAMRLTALTEIMQQEAQYGLKLEDRCAMIYLLN